MNFRVKIEYMKEQYHHFERKVTVDPAAGTVKLMAAGEHGDNGACEKCQERRRFFDEALATSKVPHAWDNKNEFLTLEGDATDIPSALDILRMALRPTAFAVEFAS